MNPYLTPLLIAAVALGSIATAQGAGLFERNEDARRHYQKAFAAPAELPTETLRDRPCDGDGSAGPFPCKGIDLESFTPLAEFTGDTSREALGGGVSDVWGWVDPDSGDEYAMVGKTHGTAFFRITDPSNPEYLGELPSGAVAHLLWYDIKVFRDHAFIVSESNPHGMQIFDLRRLRHVTPDDPQQFDADALYPASGIHNLAINEDSGYAYIVGGNTGLVVPDPCRSGLHIVDISDPTSPLFAGCHTTEGGPGTAAGIVGGPDSVVAAYVHDTLCVTYDGPDDEHDGREICFNSSETHVSIVDVTDKLLPTVLGTYEYDGVAYTHQGWLTEDQAYFLFGDELDESDNGHPTRTHVLDVTDLDDPKKAGDGVHEHETAAIDHNMFVLGDLVYQSNYRAGLRVLDLEQVADGTLEEVAFFDVYPEDDAAEFDGTWGNYPYFPSGTIAVSGYDGLWLLRLQEGLANRYYPPRPTR
ncbi:MAG: choice-of-anchor B family protein [Actinobacteria bacterium]|nr:choice-of-anchor B family protein [Actinomycetota bacterium]